MAFSSSIENVFHILTNANMIEEKHHFEETLKNFLDSVELVQSCFKESYLLPEIVENFENYGFDAVLNCLNFQFQQVFKHGIKYYFQKA